MIRDLCVLAFIVFALVNATKVFADIEYESGDDVFILYEV